MIEIETKRDVTIAVRKSRIPKIVGEAGDPSDQPLRFKQRPNHREPSQVSRQTPLTTQWGDYPKSLNLLSAEYLGFGSLCKLLL